MHNDTWAGLGTYSSIVDEEVDVEAEGDRNGHQADQLVQLYFASLFPRQLLDFNPIGHLGDEALAVLLALLALVRG